MRSPSRCSMAKTGTPSEEMSAADSDLPGDLQASAAFSLCSAGTTIQLRTVDDGSAAWTNATMRTAPQIAVVGGITPAHEGDPPTSTRGARGSSRASGRVMSPGPQAAGPSRSERASDQGRGRSRAWNWLSQTSSAASARSWVGISLYRSNGLRSNGAAPVFECCFF